MGRHQSIAWEAWINLFWKTWVQQISPKWFVEVLFYLADNLASWVLWIKCVWCKSQLIWLPVDQDKRSEVAHAVLSLRTNFGKLHVPSRSDLTARSLVLVSFPGFFFVPHPPILQVGALWVHQWASHVPPIVKWKMAAFCCSTPKRKKKVRCTQPLHVKSCIECKQSVHGIDWGEGVLLPPSFHLRRASLYSDIYSGSRHLPFSN